MVRANERRIGVAIMKIAASQPNSVATFPRIKKEVPNLINLSQEDWAPSKTRNGEPMWHQIVRNIKSHYTAEGNLINDGYIEHIPRVGYKITESGKNFLRNL